MALLLADYDLVLLLQSHDGLGSRSLDWKSGRDAIIIEFCAVLDLLDFETVTDVISLDSDLHLEAKQST